MEKNCERKLCCCTMHKPFFVDFKQNLSTMEEFIHEFYQLYIHVDHQEANEQLAARYVNCLNFSIQDELSMHRVHIME